MSNKMLKRPYWNIDSDFNFYFEFEKTQNVSELVETLNLKKIKNNIYQWKNKQIFFDKITTFGKSKNGDINDLRLCILGKTWKENIDFVLGYHPNTKLFFLFENTTVTKVDTVSSLNIYLYDFWYFNKFNKFKYFYKTNSRYSNCWVFKDKKIIFQLLENKNIYFNLRNEYEYKKIQNQIKKLKQDLKLTDEHEKLLKELENEFNNNKKIKEVFEKNILDINKRINQNYWRNQLISKYDGKCLLTSLHTIQVLEACHIKWNKDCKRKERIDLKNGILLSPTFHKLFDRGLFTFNNKFEIVYSNIIDEKDKKLISDSIKNKENYSNILKELVDQKYLEYHRKNIFKIS